MNAITLGSFLVLHYGHIRLFKRCKSMADKLTVAINTDEFIESYKGKKPILSYQERFKAIEELDIADNIVPNSQMKPGDDCKDVILDTDSDLIIIGSDWGRKPYLEQLGLDWDWMDEHGISLAYVPYTWGISTTEIIKRCKLA